MIKINLLPHRQTRRAERQRQFNLMLVATLIAGGAIVFTGQTYIDDQIENQTARNARLDSAITKLDKQISSIKDLRGQIQDVLDRKRVVENLQTDRSQSVILLDEMARLLPEGIFLKSLKQQGNKIDLEGYADTNARVATLVRNLGNSQWFENPVLIEIKAATTNKNVKQSEFSLKVDQRAGKSDDATQDKKGGKGA